MSNTTQLFHWIRWHRVSECCIRGTCSQRALKARCLGNDAVLNTTQPTSYLNELRQNKFKQSCHLKTFEIFEVEKEQFVQRFGSNKHAAQATISFMSRPIWENNNISKPYWPSLTQNRYLESMRNCQCKAAIGSAIKAPIRHYFVSWLARCLWETNGQRQFLVCARRLVSAAGNKISARTKLCHSVENNRKASF